MKAREWKGNNSMTKMTYPTLEERIVFKLKQKRNKKKSSPRPTSFCQLKERKRAEMEYHRSLVKYWAGLEVK